MSEDLIKDANINDIAERGTAIYEAVKEKYEPDYGGQFLAIDIDSEDIFVGKESAEALQQAREAHPNKVFYVVKVGFESAEAMAHAFMRTGEV